MSKRPGDPGYAAGWCIHYRYNRDVKKPEDDTCEAGVRYDQFRGDGKSFKTQPCFLDELGRSKPDALPCMAIRRPTTEEIAVHEKWLEGRMNQMGVVMKGIQPWRRAHKGKSAQEVVECPCCHGRLHLSIAAYNGHVHGRCETDGCVTWME
jgi:hypothetical protein